MIHLLGLARHQCRVLAVLGLAGWGAVALLGVMAELAGGATLSDICTAPSLIALATVLLPELLQVALPLSLACAIYSLEEGGEMRALQSAGVRPAFVAAGLLLPLLPFVLVLHPLVHRARPAALASLKSGLVGPDRVLTDGLAGQGIGIVQDASGLRVLMPLGDAALAVAASGVERAPGALRVVDGHAQVVRPGTDESGTTAGFERVDLTIPPVRLGLSAYTEKDLTSRFLQTDPMRWRRSRIDWGGLRSGDLVRQELRRRECAPWSLAASLLSCLVLLFVSRRGAVPYLLVVPVAVGIGLFGPRGVALLVGA